MTMQNDKKQKQITTPVFRLSFANLFEAKKVDEKDAQAKAKFNLVMLYKDKSKPQFANCQDIDAADLAPLKALVRDAVVEKFGPDTTKWPTKVVGTNPQTGAPIIASALKMPFRDGAEKGHIDGYLPGMTFCSASTTMRPAIVDHNMQPIIIPSDIYSGCYCRASITAYYYKVKGNEGIAFGLRNVQKVRDGEPFSGRSKAEDDFDAIPMPEGSPAEMGPVPQGVGGPQQAQVPPKDPLFG